MTKSYENLKEEVLIKQNVKLAYDEYKDTYKKVPKGITKLKTEILLAHGDLHHIWMLSIRFFGNITKSVNAKKRR